MLKRSLIIYLASFILSGCLSTKKEEESKALHRSIFIPIPSIVVNLMPSGGVKNYLKLTLILEVSELASGKKIETVVPIIIDRLQMFIRTLKSSDLEGTTGMPRLKAYLKAEINQATSPYKIKDVLFKEVIIQWALKG